MESAGVSSGFGGGSTSGPSSSTSEGTGGSLGGDFGGSGGGFASPSGNVDGGPGSGGFPGNAAGSVSNDLLGSSAQISPDTGSFGPLGGFGQANFSGSGPAANGYRPFEDNKERSINRNNGNISEQERIDSYAQSATGNNPNPAGGYVPFSNAIANREISPANAQYPGISQDLFSSNQARDRIRNQFNQTAQANEPSEPRQDQTSSNNINDDDAVTSVSDNFNGDRPAFLDDVRPENGTATSGANDDAVTSVSDNFNGDRPAFLDDARPENGTAASDANDDDAVTSVSDNFNGDRPAFLDDVRPENGTAASDANDDDAVTSVSDNFNGDRPAFLDDVRPENGTAASDANDDAVTSVSNSFAGDRPAFLDDARPENGTAASDANDDAVTSVSNSFTGDRPAFLDETNLANAASQQTQAANPDQNASQSENGPFLNGAKPVVAVVDLFGSQSEGHGQVVTNVISSQLGDDVEIVQAQAPRALNNHRSILAPALEASEASGQKFDYINISLSDDNPGERGSVSDDQFLGGARHLISLYNAHHGLSGEEAFDRIETLTPEQQRKLVDFAIDLHEGRLNGSDNITQFLANLPSERDQSDVIHEAAGLGAFFKDGQRLIEQGSYIVISAGNNPREANGLGLLRVFNTTDPSKGGAVIVGAANGNASDARGLVSAEDASEEEIASFSSRHNVHAFAAGTFSHTDPETGQTVDSSGSSIAAPEVIVEDILSRQ